MLSEAKPTKGAAADAQPIRSFLGYSVYNLSKVCAAFLFAPIALTSYSSTRLNFFVDIASFGPVVIFSVIFGDFFLYLCDFFWYDYALFWWVLYIGSRT